jgi:hypothetical protein
MIFFVKRVPTFADHALTGRAIFGLLPAGNPLIKILLTRIMCIAFSECGDVGNTPKKETAKWRR